jgi:hypothetical protein
MELEMTSPWIVGVTSISADFEQEFVIKGALQGNGTYAGSLNTPPVFVIPHPGVFINQWKPWTINIRNNPGNGFQNSETRISNNTGFQFDIESDDAGGDKDFNDLILTCFFLPLSHPLNLQLFYQFPIRYLGGFPGEGGGATVDYWNHVHFVPPIGPVDPIIREILLAASVYKSAELIKNKLGYGIVRDSLNLMINVAQEKLKSLRKE